MSYSISRQLAETTTVRGAARLGPVVTFLDMLGFETGELPPLFSQPKTMDA